MATGTIMNNSNNVIDISSYITPANGCTISSAKCSGKVVEITGSVPANLASGKTLFTLSGYSPASFSYIPTIRNTVNGSILVEGTSATYYTATPFAYSQSFQVMYLTQ